MNLMNKISYGTFLKLMCFVNKIVWKKNPRYIRACILQLCFIYHSFHFIDILTVPYKIEIPSSTLSPQWANGYTQMLKWAMMA